MSGARRTSGPRIVWPGARWKHFFARPVSATSIGQVYAHLHEAVRTVPHPAGLKSRPAQWLSFGRGAGESLLKISTTLHLCKFQSQIPNSQTIGGVQRGAAKHQQLLRTNTVGQLAVCCPRHLLNATQHPRMEGVAKAALQNLGAEKVDVMTFY